VRGTHLVGVPGLRIARVARGASGEVRTKVLEGDARDKIAAMADRRDAQPAVVGAHGRSLVGEAILGSTALSP
jgi:nucleotide-binding universal stress UspA family protein